MGSTRLSDTRRGNLVFFHGEHPGVGSIVPPPPMGRLNRVASSSSPPPPRQPSTQSPSGFTYFPARQAHPLKATILQRRARALGRVHTATTARVLPCAPPYEVARVATPLDTRTNTDNPFSSPIVVGLGFEVGLVFQVHLVGECPVRSVSQPFVKIYLGCCWMRLLSERRRGATRRLSFVPAKRFLKF